MGCFLEYGEFVDVLGINYTSLPLTPLRKIEESYFVLANLNNIVKGMSFYL